MRAGKPVAGQTGKNLEEALIHLKSAQPARFPSLDRYDYRITNAFSTPMAKALGHSTSEASNAEIRAEPNVRRVIQEIAGCTVVVLSGNKARLFATDIGAKGMTVGGVPHVGNTGLNGSYGVPDRLRLAPSLAREHRVKQWADAVLRAIAGEDA